MKVWHKLLSFWWWWKTQFFWVGHYDFFFKNKNFSVSNLLKLVTSLWDTKDGMKFWWLLWFQLKTTYANEYDLWWSLTTAVFEPRLLQITKLSLLLFVPFQVIIMTGPNACGKSVYLKQVRTNLATFLKLFSFFASKMIWQCKILIQCKLKNSSTLPFE